MYLDISTDTIDDYHPSVIESPKRVRNEMLCSSSTPFPEHYDDTLSEDDFQQHTQIRYDNHDDSCDEVTSPHETFWLHIVIIC